MNNHKSTIPNLAVQLANARAAESAARDHRIRIEESILAQVDTPEKGTVTIDAQNGLKITIKTELGYKADLDEIAKIDSDLLKHTEKHELDVKTYEALRESDPALFARVSEHVITQPRKPAVTLKVV